MSRATEKVGFCPLCQHLEGDLGERQKQRERERERGPEDGKKREEGEKRKLKQ